MPAESRRKKKPLGTPIEIKTKLRNKTKGRGKERIREKKRGNELFCFFYFREIVLNFFTLLSMPTKAYIRKNSIRMYEMNQMMQ
jgi:hypothetical protein